MKIAARENGPYIIETPSGAGFEVETGQNTHTIDAKVIALCRCGHSATKPLCDGAHKQCGFTAPAATIVVR